MTRKKQEVIFEIKEYMVCYSCNMLYSTACEYAIRALAFLALKEKGRFSSLEDIVAHNGLRQPFMAKVLQQLVKQRLVSSQKGPGGGFSLGKVPQKITLLEIVKTIDGEPNFSRCAVGLAECSDQMPCPLHNSWKHLRTQIRTYLESQTVEDLAKAVEKKLEYLEKTSPKRVRL